MKCEHHYDDYHRNIAIVPNDNRVTRCSNRRDNKFPDLLLDCRLQR